MHYITDYQLDINKGFMCKVNGKTFKCEFLISNSAGKLFYISNILHVADAMGIPRQEFTGIFNNDYINHVIYCDSRQQCYDLCQHIVKTYFRPKQTEHERLVPDEYFTYNDKSYQFTLKILNGKYVWQNVNDICTHIFIKTHPDLPKIKKELNINISISGHSEYLGFDTKEDAIKFAKYVIKYYYSRIDEKESCKKSRRHLTKYYLNNALVKFNKYSFKLQPAPKGGWFWHCIDIDGISKDLWLQFTLNNDEVLTICNFLSISAYFHGSILIFKTPIDAVKFTDYLIETYIIKKEKTYDTNQLRKKRASLSRGAKPAGSIIHGRRSKASVRCGCIEHKACLGN